MVGAGGDGLAVLWSGTGGRGIGGYPLYGTCENGPRRGFGEWVNE